MLRSLLSALLAMTLLVSLCLPAGAAEEGKSVFVRMDTSEGTIVLELFPDEAPQTVRNFLKYVVSGFYEGTVFHRVYPSFMIQAGGFEADLKKKMPLFDPIENEADNGLSNEEFSIAMARTNQPHSATSEFFINTKNNSGLNHSAPTPDGWGYCVFGRVAAGKLVVDKIKTTKVVDKGGMPFERVPVKPVVIEKMTVVDR